MSKDEFFRIDTSILAEQSWDDSLFKAICYCYRDGASLAETINKLRAQGYSDFNVMSRWDEAVRHCEKIRKLNIDDVIEQINERFGGKNGSND